MSSNSYTPGPWIADTVHAKAASGGWVSFRIRTSDKRGVCCATSTVKRDPLEMEANARLVAMAPDMLEALEMLLRLHETTPFHYDSTAVKAARAVIAKATGVERNVEGQR